MRQVSLLSPVPDTAELPVLAEAAQGCRNCDLYANATQAVFGEGAARSDVMLIGEQPGDEEDRQGRPFVGPAGRVLADAVSRAGLRREDLYVTNAVKHFRFEERGKRRIHKTPSTVQVAACQPWLEAELAIVRPKWIICLGATAALTVFGKRVGIEESRGRLHPHASGAQVVVTYHPSAVLRAEDRAPQLFEALVEDLSRVAR